MEYQILRDRCNLFLYKIFIFDYCKTYQMGNNIN